MRTFIPILLLIGIVAALAQSITEHTKFISRPAGEARKIVEKAVTLKAGDSYQTVTNALGKPDLDQAFAARAEYSGQTNMPPAQRMLHYNLSRPEGTPLGGANARYVQVFIDFKTERVDSIFIHASLR